jgi:hypothetical protein
VAVGADEVDVLAAVGTGVGVERAAGNGRDAIAGELVEVVVDPVAGRVVEALVDVAVDANVVDVLLGEVGNVVGVGHGGAPVARYGSVGSGRDTEIGDDPADADDVVFGVVCEPHLELVAGGEDEAGHGDEPVDIFHDGVFFDGPVIKGTVNLGITDGCAKEDEMYCCQALEKSGAELQLSWKPKPEYQKPVEDWRTMSWVMSMVMVRPVMGLHWLERM